MFGPSLSYVSALTSDYYCRGLNINIASPKGAHLDPYVVKREVQLGPANKKRSSDIEVQRLISPVRYVSYLVWTSVAAV